MGLYISRNAFGGMSGRRSSGVLTDLLSWRWAVGIIRAEIIGTAAAAIAPFSCPAHIWPETQTSSLFGALQVSASRPPSDGLSAYGDLCSIYNYLWLPAECCLTTSRTHVGSSVHHLRAVGNVSLPGPATWRCAVDAAWCLGAMVLMMGGRGL